MTRSVYLDSSAIVKLIKAEAGSLALVDYLDASMQCSTSAISSVEVVRALRRSRVPLAEIDDAMRGFFLIGLDAEISEIAGQAGPHVVRSLDAIHLASALGIGDESLEFVTYDDRLAAAARDNGLRVVQPGR
ncbi:MAG: type II toxin-antitoxin system VapC family toxin [Vicinamibacterales bacterium]